MGTQDPRFSGLGRQHSSTSTTSASSLIGSTPYPDLTNKQTYPFYPDRLDPAKITNPNPDNEVKWYYSNYNNEHLEPYVDPRGARDHIEAAKVLSSSSQTYHCNFSLVIVMLSLPTIF